jgi:hypothetical protein
VLGAGEEMNAAQHQLVLEFATAAAAAIRAHAREKRPSGPPVRDAARVRDLPTQRRGPVPQPRDTSDDEPRH